MSRKHEPHVFIFLQVVEGGLEFVVARAAGAAEAKASSAVAPALVVHLRHDDDQEVGGGTLLRARGNSSSGPLAAAPVAVPAAAELRVRDAHW